MIYNINSPNCKLAKSEKIIIDTNILLMVFYSPYIQQGKTYKQNYQNFFYRCISNKMNLYTTQGNIREALHVIDNISLSIYNIQNKTDLDLKQYHKIETEVIKVHKDMDIFYKCVSGAINIISNEDIDKWINDYFNATNSLDLYDYDLIITAKQNKITNILTDDSDFVSDMNLISGLNLLSQNSKILNVS